MGFFTDFPKSPSITRVSIDRNFKPPRMNSSSSGKRLTRLILILSSDTLIEEQLRLFDIGGDLFLVLEGQFLQNSPGGLLLVDSAQLQNLVCLGVLLFC